MSQILFFFAAIIVVTRPLGVFMARVFGGERTWLHPFLRPVERLIYRLGGIHEDVEQRWTQYAGSVLAFGIAAFVFTYAIQRLQGVLPLNPQRFGASLVSPDLAFNTAVSFMTNTNWQAYAGESTFSYFVQMAALTVQNFASAAAGLAVAIALTRGLARRESATIGNFWVDTTRAIVYVLLPMAFAASLVLVSQGAVQNWDPYTRVTTVEGTMQTIAQGPVASQEAIKQLGTNGGGFFNANSAHPFENPTPASTFLQVFLIFAIPAGLTYTFGCMVRDVRQGWAIFAAMSVMFFVGVFAAYGFEQRGNPILGSQHVETAATSDQPGGNMEGKEVRFGIVQSALFATVTTDASCGAVNGAHDSFTPLGGLVPLFNIQAGEVIFGGVGAGLYGMLLYAILAVFIAGLMVGRTPEYVCKKIEQKEVKMAMLALIATAFGILVFTAISAAGPGIADVGNAGPHGLTEMLYAYTSAAGNNGSAFGGLAANTRWYDLTIGLAMLIGRFLFLLPMLAIAGSLAAKKTIPVTSGTLPTHGALFVGLLIGTVVIVGALTFFPVLSLGPIVEHFLMNQGRQFSLLLPSVSTLSWL